MIGMARTSLAIGKPGNAFSSCIYVLGVRWLIFIRHWPILLPNAAAPKPREHSYSDPRYARQSLRRSRSVELHRVGLQTGGLRAKGSPPFDLSNIPTRHHPAKLFRNGIDVIRSTAKPMESTMSHK